MNKEAAEEDERDKKIEETRGQKERRAYSQQIGENNQMCMLRNPLSEYKYI